MFLKTSKGRLAVALFCVSAALPQVAFAGDPVRASAPSAEIADRAMRLKKQGDEAILNIKYADALRLYEESLRLLPNPALHYNRGRAFEALERTVEAIEAYETFLREARTELRSKTPGLAEHVGGLRRKTAKLALDVDVAGARVRLRQIVLGTTPIEPVTVNAGPATVEVEAEGYVSHRADLELAPGSELALRVRLVPKAKAKVGGGGATAATEPSPAPIRSERSETVLDRWWFWAGLGVVVAGGATVVVVALGSQSDPPPREGTLGSVRF